jgi:hypothetical protein
MKRSMIQIVSSVLIVALLLTTAGCFGSFQLVNKVYKFNGTLGGKFVNELGFLVMVIVPVYGIATFVDVVVLNTIEFWTGKNPSSASNGIQTIDLPEGRLVLNNGQKSYELKQVINGVEQVVRVEYTDNGTIVKDADGIVLARSVRTQDGGVTVYDANGTIVSSLTKGQVESLLVAK